MVQPLIGAANEDAFGPIIRVPEGVADDLRGIGVVDPREQIADPTDCHIELTERPGQQSGQVFVRLVALPDLADRIGRVIVAWAQGLPAPPILTVFRDGTYGGGYITSSVAEWLRSHCAMLDGTSKYRLDPYDQPELIW